MNNPMLTLEKMLLIWQIIAVASIVLGVLLAFANLKMKSNLNVYLQETTAIIHKSNKYLSELVSLKKCYEKQTQELNLLKEKINEKENHN